MFLLSKEIVWVISSSKIQFGKFTICWKIRYNWLRENTIGRTICDWSTRKNWRIVMNRVLMLFEDVEWLPITSRDFVLESTNGMMNKYLRECRSADWQTVAAVPIPGGFRWTEWAGIVKREKHTVWWHRSTRPWCGQTWSVYVRGTRDRSSVLH